MITNIPPYNIYNNNQRKQPSFTALYFKNEKIQRKVQNSPYFAKVLDNGWVENAIKDYNVVITDVPKWFQRGWNFKFRGCTEVVQNGKDVVPAGFKSPVFYEKDKSLYRNLTVLDYKDTFDKLYFKNNKTQEAFINNMLSKEILDYLQEPSIQKMIGKNKIYITKVEDEDIKFIICRNITQNKKGENIPEGYQSALFYRQKPYSYGVLKYKENIDKIIALYDKLHFKNDKVKQQFLAHQKHDNFLTNNVVQDAVKKYNILITDSKKDIKYVICSDISQKGNKITPANMYTAELNYGQIDKDNPAQQGLEHLERLIKFMQPQKTNIADTQNKELFF